MEPLDPEIPRALARPEAHPHDPEAAAGVEVVQTHLSWVFLTRGRVSKLRKAARLGFVDFGSRAERNADCLREVALNRRLAPDVYLGVAPVLADPLRVGPTGETLAGDDREHCVVMRRLPDGRDALSLLEAGRLEPAQLDLLARRLARFHAAHGLGAGPFDAETWRRRLLDPVEANFRHLEGCGLEPERVERLAGRARERLAARAARFEARRRAGRVVDGHGDVHLQHVWFERDDAEPVLIDAIEFDDSLRQVDAASEVAFLAMDLAYRGRPELGERFLRAYAAASDDFDLYAVVDWFASYRAAVRAKVACLASRDPAIPDAQRRSAAESARRHFELAERFLQEPSPGALVLVGGVVGTGKSSAAALLADACGGVVIASDRVRKHRAGLAETDRSGAEAGLYSEAGTDAVYAACLERAAPVVASGRTAILDATFSRRRHREAAADWATRRSVAVRLVETRCDPEALRARLARRAAAGRDVSDAGPELLEWSLARWESPEEWPDATHHVLETDRDDWGARAGALGGRLPAPWHRS